MSKQRRSAKNKARNFFRAKEYCTNIKLDDGELVRVCGCHNTAGIAAWEAIKFIKSLYGSCASKAMIA